MCKRKYWSEPKRHTEKDAQKKAHATQKMTQKKTAKEQPQQANLVYDRNTWHIGSRVHIINAIRTSFSVCLRSTPREQKGPAHSFVPLHKGLFPAAFASLPPFQTLSLHLERSD